ncbi:MAG: type II secretion system protein GspJ [Candidatus Binatia bacterium]
MKRQVEQRTTLSRTARVVLQRIADDVQASFSLSPENARFRGDTQPTSVFPHSSFSFLSFASTHLTDSGREGGWSEISYALVPDPSDAELWQLVRWAHFDPSEPQTQDSETDNSEAIPLLTGVQGFRVRFFDGRTWREEWNQEKTPGRLPQAIEIELVVAVAERRERTYGAAREVATFSTLVDVPLASTAVRRTAPRRES